MSRPLTGPEILALRDAILASLANDNELNELVLYALGRPIGQFVTPAGTKYMVRDLLQYTEARGETDQLVAAAIQMSPRNQTLRSVADTLGADDGAGKFERIVRQHLQFANTADWVKGMTDSMNAVCRVEVDGDGIGTAFLVGPSLVITNHHVSHDDANAPVGSERFQFRFDYKIFNGKKTEGVSYSAEPGPFAHDNEALDFTLIRLSVRAGEQTVGTLSNAPTRGWLKPQSRTPAVDDPVMIIQHPKADPQKFALGTIIDGTPPPDRVLYNVNTDEGSSGSPCFDSNWVPVALHHWGGVNHNRGVLFSPIRTALDNASVNLES
jgi:V8-like Glu-specific endopeptidase